MLRSPARRLQRPLPAIVNKMSDQNCYIEFEFSEDQKYLDLKNAFEEFGTLRNGENIKDDKYWLDAFPDYAKRKFYFAESDLKPAFGTAELTDSTWHFYSLTALMQYDYQIDYKEIFKLTDKTGRLEFAPYEYPYGGITGLLIFVRAFDCIPYRIDEGSEVFAVRWNSDSDFVLNPTTE